MQTYDSEEIKAYVAHCKEKGIQDSSRLFWLQSAMRGRCRQKMCWKYWKIPD